MNSPSGETRDWNLVKGPVSIMGLTPHMLLAHTLDLGGTFSAILAGDENELVKGEQVVDDGQVYEKFSS